MLSRMDIGLQTSAVFCRPFGRKTGQGLRGNKGARCPACGTCEVLPVSLSPAVTSKVDEIIGTAPFAVSIIRASTVATTFASLSFFAVVSALLSGTTHNIATLPSPASAYARYKKLLWMYGLSPCASSGFSDSSRVWRWSNAMLWHLRPFDSRSASHISIDSAVQSAVRKASGNAHAAVGSKNASCKKEKQLYICREACHHLFTPLFTIRYAHVLKRTRADDVKGYNDCSLIHSTIVSSSRIFF